MRARSSSFYLCPGYKKKRCNGRYTEEEAQQMVDHNSGLFVCQECFLMYEADPNAPEVQEYTLQLVDNSKALRLAMDNMRRVMVQLSGKMIGNSQLRAGIFDLIQKVRGKGKDPITSNLPSENFALGIGSKRLAGTGRTAGIKARKLEQQGVADSATAARNYLVGGGKRSAEGSDLTFLKNAMGNEIAFSVEKGGGARASLLATRTRRRRKLMDAAATRVGTSIPLEVKIKEDEKRKALEEEKRKAEKENTKDTKRQKTSAGVASNIPLEFLNNNIGRMDLDMEMDQLRKQDLAQAEEMEESDVEEHEGEIVLLDDTEETPNLWEEEKRKAAFQSLYSKEMGRQVQLLQLEPDSNTLSSPPKASSAENEERQIAWVDCD